MFVVLITLIFVPGIVAAIGRALGQRNAPPTLPGLTAEESQDFLFLDWLSSQGLYDDGLRKRYRILAERIDETLGGMHLAAHKVPDLDPVRCGLCGEIWGATPSCPRCTSADGTPLPLKLRLPAS